MNTAIRTGCLAGLVAFLGFGCATTPGDGNALFPVNVESWYKTAVNWLPFIQKALKGLSPEEAGKYLATLEDSNPDMRRILSILAGDDEDARAAVLEDLVLPPEPKEIPTEDGPGGYVFKPISESDGNLVVLLPEEYRGRVTACELHSRPDMLPSSLIEAGVYWAHADGHNQGRVHYGFTKPGCAYGQNIYVMFQLEGDPQLYAYFRENGCGRGD